MTGAEFSDSTHTLSISPKEPQDRWETRRRGGCLQLHRAFCLWRLQALTAPREAQTGSPPIAISSPLPLLGVGPAHPGTCGFVLTTRKQGFCLLAAVTCDQRRKCSQLHEDRPQENSWSTRLLLLLMLFTYGKRRVLRSESQRGLFSAPL